MEVDQVLLKSIESQKMHYRSRDDMLLTDHAEHPMKLPIDEKDDKEMMSIPKLFEPAIRFPSIFLDSKPDHHTEGDGHNPPSDTRAGGEISDQELGYYFRSCGGIRERYGELGKIDHVGNDVDDSEEHYRPCNRHMKRYT